MADSVCTPTLCVCLHLHVTLTGAEPAAVAAAGTAMWTRRGQLVVGIKPAPSPFLAIFDPWGGFIPPGVVLPRF